MDYRKKLFQWKDPFDTEGSKDAFCKAMKENCAFQYKNCPEYRTILDEKVFSPEDIKDYDDLAKLPFLPTVFLKHHRIFSMPEHKRLIRATSSGTSGKYSEIGMEFGSLTNGLRMLLKVTRPRKLISPVPCHYIIFGYRPHKSNKTAIAKTALGYTFFTPALSRTFALKYKDGKYEPDLEGVIKAIVKHSKSKFPMRFIGFPAYTYFTLKMMDERGIHVKLPKNSVIMLGGGWKQFYKEQVDKQAMYDLVKRVLDVEEENVVESFGAAEHPILYCDCKKHHFHVPVYSRVMIRDVNTLEVLPHGNVGLVNLMTPMIKATPVLSIMTDDLGILHDAEECGCGVKSPYLEIIGRVGLKDVKTCAAGASEILEKAGLKG